MAAKKPDDPPHLTEEYHHARRNLNFASALLLGAELLGIRPTTNHEIDGFHFEILSPGAAVWFLILIVVFFGVRLSIEWRQCASSRRVLGVARTDYYLSYLVAFIAFGLFAYQRAVERQFFDAFFKSIAEGRALAGLLLGMIISAGAVTLRNLPSTMVPGERRKKIESREQGAMVVAAMGILALLVTAEDWPARWSLLGGSAAGLLVIFGTSFGSAQQQATSSTLPPPRVQSRPLVRRVSPPRASFGAQPARRSRRTQRQS